MDYLATNKQLRKQVETLQKYLVQVVEHSDIEVRDHEICERIWKKEKQQLKLQIQILKQGGKIENTNLGNVSTVDNGTIINNSKEISYGELETSVIHLTNERDHLKDKVNALSAKLGIQPNYNEKNSSNSNDIVNEIIPQDANNNYSNGIKLDQKKETPREPDNSSNRNKNDKNVNDEIIMQRIIDENTELHNKIELYDKQLEDAKIAVLKAAAVIKELNKDIDHERKQKEEYKTAFEELELKLKRTTSSTK